MNIKIGNLNIVKIIKNTLCSWQLNARGSAFQDDEMIIFPTEFFITEDKEKT